MASQTRLSVADYQAVPKLPVVVVLDSVRSLNNVGSVFRTCDAFRAEKLVLCGVTGTPPDREIEKTALGATQSVKWEHAPSAVEALKALKAKGYHIAAIEQAPGSISLADFNYQQQPIALVFGNEVYGVEAEVLQQCDVIIEIPQHGTKQSLNVSVCAGIVLWEVCGKNKIG